MQFNSVKRGNFSGLAKATNRAMDTVFDAARKTAVDNTAIAKESIKGRGLERRAAMKAEGEVAQAGLKAVTKVKLTDIDIDAAKSIRKSKASAARMAGIVGGLGAIAGGYVMMEGNKRDKAERDELRAYRDELDAKAEARDAARDKRDQEQIDRRRAGYSNTEKTTFEPPAASVSSTSALSGSATIASANTGTKGKSLGMRYMRELTNSGMSPTQAAALVGHLHVESDGFRAHEEYAPNAYGTKGAGVLQWTDIPGGSQRRTEFQNWSQSQGLDPKSFEANSGYLLQEMGGNKHWTGGGSLSGFKGINNLQEASRYLESNYIRPSAGSSGRRQSEAEKYLNQWNAL